SRSRQKIRISEDRKFSNADYPKSPSLPPPPPTIREKTLGRRQHFARERSLVWPMHKLYLAAAGAVVGYSNF
ncbi:MAG TPA: hypothetical protein VE713_06905, partial [Pyrinomonadaceae bacterium]|nr:hypothetical protein [Pyrinomonadaceae bacterium]